MKLISPRVVLLVCCLIFSFALFAIKSEQRNDFLKKQFFTLQGEDPNGAIEVLDELLESENKIDKAFAYAAKLFLSTRSGELIEDEEEYLDRIHTLVAEGDKNEETYEDLTNTYNLLGVVFTIKGLFDKSLESYIIASDYAVLSGDILQQIKIDGNIAQ